VADIRWLVVNRRFEFPALQTIGEDLVTVLDFLHIKYVVCLGEGAGANVLARFGLKYPSRCLGLILINCTGSAASVMDSLKNKVTLLDRKNEVLRAFGSRVIKYTPDIKSCVIGVDFS